MTTAVFALVDRTKAQGLGDWLVTLAPVLQRELRRFADDWDAKRPHVVVGDTLGAWPVVFIDDADQAGALAYHDVDSLGRPYSRVFVNDVEKAGVSLESAADHECKEALIDPDCVLAAQRPDGTWVAYETADPIESNTHPRGGFQFSAYVLPAWFDAAALAPYDSEHIIDAPFKLAPGGYDIETKLDGTWTYVFADEATRARFAERADKHADAARGVRRGARPPTGA